jgi:hypothetical protein
MVRVPSATRRDSTLAMAVPPWAPTLDELRSVGWSVFKSEGHLGLLPCMICCAVPPRTPTLGLDELQRKEFSISCRMRETAAPRYQACFRLLLVSSTENRNKGPDVGRAAEREDLCASSQSQGWLAVGSSPDHEF